MNVSYTQGRGQMLMTAIQHNMLKLKLSSGKISA